MAAIDPFPMDKTHMIAFLRAKMAAFAARVTPASEGAAMQRSHEPILEGVERGTVPAPALGDLDSELDSVIRMALRRKGAKEIEAELENRFGFGSLSMTPAKKVRRILKQGSIASLEEARVVRDLLADTPATELIGAAQTRQLDAFLAAWEKSAPKE